MAVWLLLISTACWAATEFPRIDSFPGAPEDYELFRNGQTIPLTYYMPVLPGDKILVKRANGYIRLLLGPDGKVVRICASNTTEPHCDARGPFTVSDSEGQKGASAAVFAEIIAQIGRGLTFIEEKGVAKTHTRGGANPATQMDLGVKMLEGRLQAIVGGSRNLALSWQGGLSPFQLVITREEGAQTVLELKSLSDRQIDNNPVSLQPGMYSLELSDASAKFDAQFMVVTDAELPRFPSALIDEQLPPEMRQTAQAAWLAAQGARRWRWEAYLRLEGLPQDYGPARRLREALRNGMVPQIQ
ncbi:MAG: hypothetical protein JO159_09585 [Acidobacteria bacterium]|nr:hypothetical protein [Acidobacteriota bacterium]MBV9624191.1 hypothetical protein [Acidobacteriota bacterium]